VAGSIAARPSAAGSAVVTPSDEPDRPRAAASSASAAPAVPKSGGAHYTLQLSAFQDRAEADEFAKKLSGTGYKANIVAADIPGRGIWYRVRVGDFPSQKAAVEAKVDFERKLHMIAYVTRL
jgi:cell division septation protein DedD